MNLFFSWSRLPWSRALGKRWGLLSCRTLSFAPLGAVSPCSAVHPLGIIRPIDIHCVDAKHTAVDPISRSPAALESHKRHNVCHAHFDHEDSEGRGQRAMVKPLFNELVSAVLGGSKGEKEPGKQRVGKTPSQGNSMCKSPEAGRTSVVRRKKARVVGADCGLLPMDITVVFLCTEEMLSSRGCSLSLLWAWPVEGTSVGGCLLAAVAFSAVQSQYFPSKWPFPPSIHPFFSQCDSFIPQISTEHLLYARHIVNIKLAAKIKIM